MVKSAQAEKWAASLDVVVVALVQEYKNQGEDGEHSGRRSLPVPDTRLPHQKPLASHGDEGDEPLEKACDYP
jgi:hypothetical protein